MKLYVPEIGDELTLTADWTFALYNEYRNETLMEVINDPRQTTYGQSDSIPCTIPAGSVLKVDRIYIRKGISEFSSLTFLWKGMRTNPKDIERDMVSIGYGTSQKSTYTVKKPARPVRFWAKLDDVNKIEFEKV